MVNNLLEMQSYQQIIIEKANELGFPLIGFGKATALTEDASFYSKWIEKGKNGEMQWMSNGIEERANPNLILPSCKSVIVLAMPYYIPIKHTAPTGKIARYAWGWDYHSIIKPKLFALNNFIKEIFPEAEFYNSVDSGRVLEKAWAVKSGIGWRGKNSLVITQEFGSYVFLAIIYTNIEFEYSQEISNKCGTCNICIKKCPTQAIEKDNNINATKCLSYWLNEASRNHKIPKSIQEKNPGWVYGCDSCQEVCPYNRNLKGTNERLFYPRLNQTNINTEYIQAIQQEEFSRRFKESPIKRAKLIGLKENNS